MAERLIRESDVIKLIDKWLDNYPLPRHVEKGLTSHEELLAYIADAPTIEAKPIVHAHWERDAFGVWCSRCEKSALWNCYEMDEESEFCPHCGAQMDELVSKTDELNSSEKPNSCDHIAEAGKKEPYCGHPQEGNNTQKVSVEKEDLT